MAAVAAVMAVAAVVTMATPATVTAVATVAAVAAPAAAATVTTVATTVEQAAQQSAAATAAATSATEATMAAEAAAAAAATKASASLSGAGVHRHRGEANHGQEQGDAQNQDSIHPRNLQKTGAVTGSRNLWPSFLVRCQPTAGLGGCFGSRGQATRKPLPCEDRLGRDFARP
jgi:hypothetical protein